MLNAKKYKVEAEVFKGKCVFFGRRSFGKHELQCHYVYCSAAALVESRKRLEIFLAGPGPNFTNCCGIELDCIFDNYKKVI